MHKQNTDEPSAQLAELRAMVQAYSTAPTMAHMPRRSLADKGIDGPTGAHVIEEVHTPFNLAYITVSTGSTAFQNIVGVTGFELAARAAAAHKALALAGVEKGETLLFCYPPLVSVFSAQALRDYPLSWFFLEVSSRDALLLAMAERRPRVVVGESSFLRAALQDAARAGLDELLPRGVVFITAGTPLDLDFPETARQICGGTVHDLYGCQEFGWLAMDGVPLRPDISLLPAAKPGSFDLIVGGLPTGDCFPVLDGGHLCGQRGSIISYARTRSWPEHEVIIEKATAESPETAQRLARSILRIKARVVRCAPHMETGAPHTVLCLRRCGEETGNIIEGPEKTALFDSLMDAQLAYQAGAKTDPAWLKTR